MDNICILDILKKASRGLQVYSEAGFRNESDFKCELFHNICRQSYNGSYLGDIYSETNTSVLHSESKIENGSDKAPKADIIFCNPRKKMQGGDATFNYEVVAALELKKMYRVSDVNKEIEKHKKYRNAPSQYYLVEPFRGKPLELRLVDRIIDNGILYFSPDTPPGVVTEHYSYSLSKQNVIDAIHTALCFYGKYNFQYQAFYWCNYEHEIKRKVTFPSEGDFNAHLYSLLKTKMPCSHIETEVIVGSNRRIDIVVFGPNYEWCIPIEVKENWDQFKKKYKDKVQKEEEIVTILNRFESLKMQKYNIVDPVLVVIQGENYYSSGYAQHHPNNNKHRSLNIVKNWPWKLNILSFNENENCVGSPTSF